MIKTKQGGDPAAVLYDAIAAAKARHIDELYVDTAGRLHTKSGLMDELDKMRRTAARLVPGAPHEVLLVMDATTGQNGLQQARQFTQSAGVTGIVLTKLDGTAKGGIAVAIARELESSRPLRRRRRKNDRPARILAGRICRFAAGVIGSGKSTNSPLVILSEVRRGGRSRRTCGCPSRIQLSTNMGAPHLDFEMWESTNPN